LKPAQYGALVEAAFKYAVAQRATDFYIKMKKAELYIFTPLGYFPVNPVDNWKIGEWKEASQENWVLAHKRSPHYWRDLIHPIPIVDDLVVVLSDEAEELRDKMAGFATAATMDVLRAEFARKKNAIRANWRALANQKDQFVLPRSVIVFLERTLKLSKAHWYDLCPLEPRWQSGHHFDVLTEPWPQAMLLCCPPDVLVDAVMGRAIIEHL